MTNLVVGSCVSVNQKTSCSGPQSAEEPLWSGVKLSNIGRDNAVLKGLKCLSPGLGTEEVSNLKRSQKKINQLQKKLANCGHAPPKAVVDTKR